MGWWYDHDRFIAGPSSNMNRRKYLRVVGVAATGSAAGCGSRSSITSATDEMTVPARIGANGFQRPNEKGGWSELLVRGVNMGIAKPGHFPGATAITKSEYARWIKQIGEMNANAIRIYTIHPPGFYEALADYNQRTDAPIYVFHGNWLTQTVLTETADAFADKVVTLYERSMRDTIDVIHGNATFEDRSGHAGGEYTADISEYVLGYIAGVEWPPEFVIGTNEANSEKRGGDYEGEYVRAGDASPFEHWLAERLEFTATYEMDSYGQQRPLSFTNWSTTDHLTHPAEPNEMDDTVSVNPNHLATTDAFRPGMFASYHIYPYSPDFLNHERKYVEYTDSDGEKSSYAGYLDDLISANNHPLLVAEFGVPASRGKTQSHVYGMDQGHNTEIQQGKYDTELFETIIEQGAAGGLVFAWQDEWFKRTWNTMNYSNPNRRPYWSDYQTCEQYFGLLSFDPGEELACTLSGNPDEWDDATRLYPEVSPPTTKDGGPTVTGLRSMADERYLYVRVAFDNLPLVEALHETPTALLLDTTPDRGITSLTTARSDRRRNNENENSSRGAKLRSERGIDFVVTLAGRENARVCVDSHYDLFYYQYGDQLGSISKKEYASIPDNGVFHPIRLALNRELRIPSQGKTIPFESYETGQLREGIGDPASDRYDSLADFHVSPSQDVIELRLPWLLLNFKDPSTRQITGDVWEGGLDTSEKIDTIGIGAVTFASPSEKRTGPSGLALPADATIAQSLPVRCNGVLPEARFARFEWDTWQEPEYHERLKRSYYTLQSVFKEHQR